MQEEQKIQKPEENEVEVRSLHSLLEESSRILQARDNFDDNADFFSRFIFKIS